VVHGAVTAVGRRLVGMQLPCSASWIGPDDRARRADVRPAVPPLRRTKHDDDDDDRSGTVAGGGLPIGGRSRARAATKRKGNFWLGHRVRERRWKTPGREGGRAGAGRVG
jgi:hypothetical protein